MNTCKHLQVIVPSHSTDISFATITILLVTTIPVVVVLATSVTCVVGCVVCKKVSPLKHGVEDCNKSSDSATETQEAENSACIEITQNPAYIPLSA